MKKNLKYTETQNNKFKNKENEVITIITDFENDILFNIITHTHKEVNV